MCHHAPGAAHSGLVTQSPLLRTPALKMAAPSSRCTLPHTSILGSMCIGTSTGHATAAPGGTASCMPCQGTSLDIPLHLNDAHKEVKGQEILCKHGTGERSVDHTQATESKEALWTAGMELQRGSDKSGADSHERACGAQPCRTGPHMTMPMTVAKRTARSRLTAKSIEVPRPYVAQNSLVNAQLKMSLARSQ